MSDPKLVYSDNHGEVWLGDSQIPEHVAAIMGDRRADRRTTW